MVNLYYALQDQGTIWKTTTRELAGIGGFTLKIDNEIVGLTKYRDHTRTLVCSKCLFVPQGRKRPLSESALCEKTGFLLVEKRKKADTLFFFVPKGRTRFHYPSYSISYLSSEVKSRIPGVYYKYTQLVMLTLLVPMGLTPICHAWPQA